MDGELILSTLVAAYCLWACVHEWAEDRRRQRESQQLMQARSHEHERQLSRSQQPGEQLPEQQENEDAQT